MKNDYNTHTHTVVCKVKKHRENNYSSERPRASATIYAIMEFWYVAQEYKRAVCVCS